MASQSMLSWTLGAQVSIIDRHWRDKYLPNLDVRPLTELIELMEDKKTLEVYAVNGGLIPFDGWVIITLNLPGNEDPDLSVSVPFLVSSLPLEMPLLGFNVVVSSSDSGKTRKASFHFKSPPRWGNVHP